MRTQFAANLTKCRFAFCMPHAKEARCSRRLATAIITLGLTWGGTLSAQEAQEPPRIFRGGIVQQLRSLTEDAFQVQKPKDSTDEMTSGKSAGIPKPPAVAGSTGARFADVVESSSDSEPTQGTPSPMESRSANLRNAAPRAGSKLSSGTNTRVVGSGATTGSGSKNSSPNSKPPAVARTTNPSTEAAASGSQNVAPIAKPPAAARTNRSASTAANANKQTNAPEVVSRRPPEYGIPVTNPKLADEAKFRFADDDGSEQRYNANSKYDDPSQLPKSGGGRVSNDDSVKVEAVENMSSAPKVARKSLPPSAKSVAPKTSAPPTTERVASKESAAQTHEPKPSSPTSKVPAGNGQVKSDAAAKVAKPTGDKTPFETTSSKNLPLPPAMLPTYPSLDGQKTEVAPQAVSVPTDLVTNETRRPTPPASATPTATTSDEALGVANPIRGGEASSDERMKMETPRLQVFLKGPQDLPVGTPAEYQVVVRNADNIPLDGVILRLEIPKGVTIQPGKPTQGEVQTERAPDGAMLVTWGFSDLPAHQTAAAPMQITAAEPRNFAVAMEWTLVPKTGEAKIAVRQPQLELALDGPSEAEYGATNMYHLQVRNRGNAPARKVTVKLEAGAFGSSNAEIGEIQPGEQQSIDVELTFNERGTITINASATSDNLISAAKVDVLVKRAIVNLAIQGADRAYHGANSAYEILVHNQGDLEARNLKAVVMLPPASEIVAHPEGSQIVDNRLIWDIPVIKPGETFAYPLQAKLTQPGENRLTASCSGEKLTCDPASYVTNIEAIADLKLVVNDPIAPAPVNGVATYELTITNRGSLAANNVRAVAQFSEGIEPVSADGSSHDMVNGQVFFDPIVQIRPGETKILKIHAKASTAGIHRFRAEVRSDESEMRLVQEETTQYLESAARIAAPMNNEKVVR